MDDTTPEPALSVEELSATVRSMAAEIERLRAIVDTPAAAAPATGAAAAPTQEAEPSGRGSVSRRAAIRRGGVMAASAVAGGAAITALVAEPAAAATVNGSGSPGVRAQGVGGDGLSASTDTNAKSAVYAYAGTAGAFGAYVLTENGARGMSVTASSTLPAAIFANGGRSNGSAVVGSGIQVQAPNGTGVESFSSVIGGDFSGTNRGLTVGGNLACIAFTPNADNPLTSTNFHGVGTIMFDGSNLWCCTASGTPGTFRQLAGSGTAGQLHVLPTPVRAYDSRSGTNPAQGPKTKLVPNQKRTIDLTVGGSGVPAGASAALLTILLVNAAAGNGNFLVWANGAATPNSNTIVWGGSTGRFASSATSAVDSAGKVQVYASLATDVVIDVVGYYR